MGLGPPLRPGPPAFGSGMASPAFAGTPAGKKAFDEPLPLTEPKIRELFAKLQAKHGTVAGGGRSAGLDRRLAAGGREGHGLPGRLPAGADDAVDRRRLSRRGRDDRRAGDDRRLRRRPGRRGHPGRDPATRPADPDPSLAGPRPGAAAAAPGRPHAAGSVRVTGPDTQGRQAPAGSRCCGRRLRGRPTGWSRISSPRWTSRPSSCRAPSRPR